MKITWLAPLVGLDLKPTWEVEHVRIHTVKDMLQPDNTRRDTMVLAIKVNEKQYRKLVEEYGRASIPVGMLSYAVIPLFPNAILWTMKSPGYGIPDADCTAFELTED